MSDSRIAANPRGAINRHAFLSLVALSATSALAGCSSSNSEGAAGSNGISDAEQTPSESSSIANSSKVLGADAPFSSADQLASLTDVQRNSINMLNYLAVLMQEIGESKNSRLLTEEIYSDLINNTSPNAVDERTLITIESILDTLESYRMISAKRERLKAIYERAQASAAMEALPDPLALLSAAQSGGLAQLALSVVYMAADSATSYSSAMSEAENQYLQSGWELDDEESEVVHNSRSEMFSYTVDMVAEYDLPGDLALTEKAVEQLVERKDTDVAGRIRFLESNSETYCALGAYWLLLAESYHEHGDWSKCLRAIEVYENLSTDILRKDRSYAKALTLAIDAALQTENDQSDSSISRWADALIANSDAGDWALRYFAAQAYVVLYRQTGNGEFCNKAFDTALNNANELLGKQHELNETYLAPIEKATTEEEPSPLDVINVFSESEAEKRKKEIDDYNKMLEEERKVELPPLYEPLVLNLELMRAMAQEDLIAEKDLANADEIIHESGDLFLTAGLDDRYTLTSDSGRASTSDADILFDHSELRVSVTYATLDTTINVKVEGEDETEVFDDWELDRVEREAESDVSSFHAVYTSQAAKDFTYKEGMKVSVDLQVLPDKELANLTRVFKAVQTKSHFWEQAAFWDDGIGFEEA